jgi:hypothetical protein
MAVVTLLTDGSNTSEADEQGTGFWLVLLFSRAGKAPNRPECQLISGGEAPRSCDRTWCSAQLSSRVRVGGVDQVGQMHQLKPANFLPSSNALFTSRLPDS